MIDAFTELERSVRAALEVYSNVHRGSGHKSLASTRLYETARDVVLEHLGLAAGKWKVIFANRRRCEALQARLETADWRCVSSAEIGLALGVHALAVRKGRLPRAGGFEGGGGTARLIGPDWEVWIRGEGRFEPGTPGIVNVVAFARALKLVRRHGNDAFTPGPGDAKPAVDILRRDGLEGLSGVELLAALRRSVIGRGLPVPTRSGDRPFVNLDNSASTPSLEEVWEAARLTLRQDKETQAAIVREAKSVVADFLGAPEEAYDILFTSNTTEAIHLAAESLAASGSGGVVLNTLLEHNSNDLPWRGRSGFPLLRLDVDDEGFLDPERLEAALREHGGKPVRLVALSGASNVLGSFNDLPALCAVAHEWGAQVLVDGAQLIAHRACDMASWGVDWLAFSAHKAYAPFGTGVLAARKGLLHPSEVARASGEENAAGIAALAKSLALLKRVGMDVVQEEERELTVRALRGLGEIPKMRLFGVTDPDSPRFADKGGVVAFEIAGMIPFRTGRELAERRGVGVRVGCHCAHLLVKRMTRIPGWAEQFQRGLVTLLPFVNLPGVVRVSLGLENDAADVDALRETLADIAARKPLPRADMKKAMKEFEDGVVGRVYAS
jgi:selenocysteine lyase/cysteine desulfurase